MLGSLGAALAAMLLGVCLGAPAGYLGGAFDAAVGWLSGAIVTVPALGIFLFVVIHYNPVPLWAFPVTLALALWTYVARAVRASFATLRVREFVEAARAAGASGPRIVFRHLLPNSAGLVVVAATGVLGQSIMIISTADFFSLGNEQTDKPTLGGLIANVAKPHDPTFGYAAPWWLWVIPIVTLGVLLVCANVSADAIDDVLDPARA
jgi:ABC-type dipeptide/oligopeptide/nickel transport system permease subunit